MLAARFEAVADRPPLSDLCPADAAELAGLLGEARALEDLPGRWQAALLSAEAVRSAGVAPRSDAAQAPAARRSCCGGH